MECRGTVLYKTIFSAVLLCLCMENAVFAGGKKDSAGRTSRKRDEAKDASDVSYDINYNYLEPKGEKIKADEVWAYVMTGREKFFSPDMPITDLCYFSADINSYGEITEIPSASFFKDYTGRKHLVITCTGRALTHLSLEPDFKVREKIIETIADASKDYDGVQIDFENVPARDADNFLTFLSDTKKAVGDGKIFSVALPARMKKISDDIYNYEKIHPLVDKVIIMAYDEHWSGSKPGSVASMEWCNKIVDYSKSVIPEGKLVMGLPFYGRSWQEEGYSSAWIFSSVNRIMNQNKITVVERSEDSVPMFTATIPVKVTMYFEDAYSLVFRTRVYEEKGITSFAFWRVGQEDTAYWNWLEIKSSDTDQ